MPHPLRHGPTVYNGHLRGPLTLTPVAERLAITTCFHDLSLSRPGTEPRSSTREATALPQRHRGRPNLFVIN